MVGVGLVEAGAGGTVQAGDAETGEQADNHKGSDSCMSDATCRDFRQVRTD